MSGTPRPDVNPSRPPTSPVGGLDYDPIPDAEVIRRSYLAHESSVRSLGLLGYLMMAPCVLVAAVAGAAAGRQAPLRLAGQRFPFEPGEAAILAGVVALMGLAFGLIGLGLRRLSPWSRWVAVVGSGLAFLSYLGRYALALTGGTNFFARPDQVAGNTISLIISGYVLLVLLSGRSGRVFGREYRAVIRQTPEIRPRVSLAAQVVIATALGAILVALLALGVAEIRRH